MWCKPEMHVFTIAVSDPFVATEIDCEVNNETVNSRLLPISGVLSGFLKSAEKNHHQRIAIAVDCNNDRLIYTSDKGQALRWGNASLARLNTRPELVHQDLYSKFTWITVDPSSGNIFAVDAKQQRIVVVNPNLPQQVFTYKRIFDNPSMANTQFRIGGIAVHPRLS